MIDILESDLARPDWHSLDMDRGGTVNVEVEGCRGMRQEASRKRAEGCRRT